MKSKKKILISVGTTQFQSLIEYTDSQEFLNIIWEIDGQKVTNDAFQFQNFEILSQIGSKGQYIPKNSRYIRLSDKISQVYASSDFIICHGGAGTLLQNLHNSKNIIAVANDTLVGNHQTQLINKLSKDNYLLGFSSVKQLKSNPNKIKDFLLDRIKFKKYQKVTKSVLNGLIFGQV